MKGARGVIVAGGVGADILAVGAAPRVLISDRGAYVLVCSFDSSTIVGGMDSEAGGVWCRGLRGEGEVVDYMKARCDGGAYR